MDPRVTGNITALVGTMADDHAITGNEHGRKSTASQHAVKEDGIDEFSDVFEKNMHQLEQGAYNSTNKKMTVAEKLEKSNWTCTREEKL